MNDADLDKALAESQALDAVYAEIAAKVQVQADAWAARWPHHCPQCQGWGGSSYTEMHGFNYGSGETLFDPCDHLPIEVCHRCGQAGMTEDDGAGPCSYCGWNYDDGMPQYEP